jgi:chromatin segregation and condensation protein Rec8/ScpA/Scc1 (kleisin family)
VQDIRYDETPIEVYIDIILARLARESPTTFRALFDGRTDRGQIIGLFLALLELMRAQRVGAEQDRAFAEIYLFPMERVASDSPPPSLAVTTDGIETDTPTGSETHDGEAE